MPDEILTYVIKDPLELNLSCMPFINDGGLFIPTTQAHSIGDKIIINLQLPAKKDCLKIEGKIVWITPKNALHHVLPGIGVQFIGADAKKIYSEIESQLDHSVEVGGYVYGIIQH